MQRVGGWLFVENGWYLVKCGRFLRECMIIHISLYETTKMRILQSASFHSAI